MEPTDLAAAESLIAEFLGRLRATTADAYRTDLRVIARFAGPRFGLVPAEEHLVAHVLAGTVDACQALLMDYMNESGKAPGTLRRQVGAALGGLLALARTNGLIRWRHHIDLPKAAPYSRAFGTSEESIARALNHLEAVDDFLARRTALIIVLAHRLGLGTREMVALRREHVDLKRERILVTVQKAPREPESAPREARKLDEDTQNCLARYFEVRGAAAGWLICQRNGGVLTERSVQRSIERLARRIVARDLTALHVRHAGIHDGFGEGWSTAEERARFSNTGYLPRFRSLAIGSPGDATDENAHA